MQGYLSELLECIETWNAAKLETPLLFFFLAPAPVGFWGYILEKQNMDLGLYIDENIGK